MIFQYESGDIDAEPSRAMRNSTMTLSEKRYLHHCSLRSVKNQRNWDKLTTPSKESLLPTQSFLRTHEYGETENEHRSSHKPKSIREQENERVGILLERQISKFSLTSEPWSRNPNFKPFLIEVSRNWMKLLTLSEGKLIVLLQVMNNSNEINYYFKNNCHKQNLDVRDSYQKCSWHGRIEESSRVTNRPISEKRLIENQGTISELMTEFKNNRMKSIVWMTWDFFTDAEWIKTKWDYPSQQALFPLYLDPGWLLSDNERPPDIWNTQGISGKVL